MPTYERNCEVCGTEFRRWGPADSPPRFCGMACKLVGMPGQVMPRKYNITAYQSERIRKTYQSGTGQGQVKALAKELHLPRWKVSRYALKRGWVQKNHQVSPLDRGRERHIAGAGAVQSGSHSAQDEGKRILPVSRGHCIAIEAPAVHAKPVRVQRPCIVRVPGCGSKNHYPGHRAGQDIRQKAWHQPDSSAGRG